MIDQRDAVYAWTYDLFPKQPKISIAEAQQIVQHVWFFYGRKNAPLVLLTEGHGVPATGSAQIISLPGWATTKAIVLHEVAHSLSRRLDGSFEDEGFDGHGPLYVKLAIDLYAMFMGVSREHMMERAAHFGVEVA